MTADASGAVPVGVDAAKAPARRQPRRRAQGNRGNARATGTATAQSKTSHKAISEAIAKYVVMTTVLYGSYVTSGTEYASQSDEAIMTDEEAQAIADPVAKLIERSSVSKYAGAIVGGEEWMIAAAALFSYGQRVAPMQAAKTQQKRDRKPAAEKVQRPAGQPRGKARNGHRVPENAQPGDTVVFGGAGPVQATGAGYGLGVQHGVDL